MDRDEGVVGVLLRAAADLTRPGDRDAILSSLLDGLAELVPYDTANVELRDEDGVFRVHAVRGYERFGQDSAIRAVIVDPTSSALVGEIVRERMSILVADARLDPRWEVLAGGEHVRSWIGVPLLVDDEVIGIYSIDKAEAGFFTEEHMRLVELLAPHASLAIERSAAEHALRESESRLFQILEELPVGIFVVDATGAPYYSNRMSAEILGRAEADPPPPVFGPLGQALAQALLGERPRLDEVEVEREGDLPVIPIELTAAPVYDATGKVALATVAFNDISDRHDVEQRLLQSQRLEAIGQLAGGVAHDFNNILTAISGYADLAMAHSAPDDVSFGYLTEIAQAAERATALTQRLVAFSRGQVVNRRTLDLVRVVGGLEGMLRRLIGEHIDLRIELDSSPLVISADLSQLEQLIVNLVVNARDAMLSGGGLIIRAGMVDLGVEADARAGDSVLAAPTAGRHVTLSVSDTGSGIDRATMARLFEPFFTTKPVGSGTGLGLATVYGVVQQANGRIGVESEVGRGTTFTVYLPPADAVDIVAEPAGERSSSPEGTETVLYAEDDDAVRIVVAKLLEELGYTVLAAASGAAALALLREHDGEVHALLTDMVMPGMSGEELVDYVRQERPGIAVLVASGYLGDPLSEARLNAKGIPSLSKPLGRVELGERLRAVIAAAKGVV